MAINIQQVGNMPIAPPTEPTLQQEAFTAVLPTTENLNKDIMAASLKRLAMNEAEKQRQQKAIDDHIKMFDFDTVGVWDEGFDGIMEFKDEGLKKFANPEFFKKYDSGDGNALREYSKFKDGVLSRVYQEKQAAEAYKQYDKLLNSDQKYKVLDANGVDVNRKALEDWKNQKEHSIGDLPDFQMQVYNPALSVKYVQTLPQVDGSVSTPQADGSVKTTGIKYTDPKAASDALMAMYSSDTEQQQGILQDMLSIIQDNPDRMVNIYQDEQTGEYSKPKTVMVNGVPTVVVPPIKQIPISTATPQQVYIDNGYTPNAKGVIDIKQTEGSSGSGLTIDLGNGITVPTNALDRYKFIREGLIDKPENLTSLLIGGKLNGGTITKVDRQLAGVEMNGAVPKGIGKKYDLVLTYDKDGTKKTYTIKVDPETSQGVLEINNILNQVREGTSQFVNPEDINKIYQSDYKIGDVLESVQPSKIPTSGTQQQGGVKPKTLKTKSGITFTVQ